MGMWKVDFLIKIASLSPKLKFSRRVAKVITNLKHRHKDDLDWELRLRIR